MSKEEFSTQKTIPDVPAGESLEGAEDSVIQVPKTIGPYPIDALLDKGGMSLVYLGKNPDDGSPLTIKVLQKKYLDRPELVDRFFNEAGIIALADHPNIVKLFGHGEWENGLYIAMEYIKGTSLKEYITRQKLEAEKAVDVLLEIAGAICHLHSNGVVHRDIKPENILFTENGSVKVVDFGISQLLGEKIDERITQSGRLMGTPIYMAPELKENPLEASFPADLYSLGIIAYEIMTGKLSHGVIDIQAIEENFRPIISKSVCTSLTQRYEDIVDMMMDLNSYKNTGRIEGQEAPPVTTEEDEAIEEKSEEKPSNAELDGILEDLSDARASLLPYSVPRWKAMDIGLVNHNVNRTTGVYYDFFELKGGSYGIIMAESTAPGTQGLVYTSVLRGMVRSLSWSASKPVELVAYLNDLLVNDPFDQIFTISYLIVNPEERQFYYVSCGHGVLWKLSKDGKTCEKITADNIALGIDPDAEFVEVKKELDTNDTLILATFRAISSGDGKGLSEKEFAKICKSYAGESPQTILDGIFDKMNETLAETLKDRPLTLISAKIN